MIRDELKKALEKALGQVKLEHPGDSAHGDFSIFKAPLEIAEKIATKLQSDRATKQLVDKIEVVPPGFINFWLSEAAFSKELERALKEGERYSEGKLKAKKKIMVEFTDPNPFKQFHIGHLYSNTVGEALCRLFEAQGAEVWRVNYQGDVGLHVGKALWGFKLKVKSSKLKVKELEKKPLAERVAFLGEAYALGNRAYEEDPEAKKEIEELNRKVYRKDPEIKELYEKGREWSLQYFDTVYARLGTKFKRYYFESEAGEAGLKLVKKHLKDGIFEESEGAVIFPGEKYGLHNRVFVNSQGLPTYEAKDMGLAPTKFKDFSYDESYIVTGNEQLGYFKVVLEALRRVNTKLGEKTRHIAHGVVRLPGGKMGSRTGAVITAEWLLDEAKERVRALVNRKPRTVNRKTENELRLTNDELLEAIAVGAVKYALLRSSIGKDVVFDFEKSLNFEGDSGPYLQYTYARTQSVLRKAKSAKRKVKLASQGLTLRSYKLNPEEENVLRTFYKFPEIVQDAAEGFAPNLVCNFLFDLAQKYNAFYNKHRILVNQVDQVNQVNQAGSINSINQLTQSTQAFRLALNTVVGSILKSGLNLLGIQAPERM